MVLAIGYRIPMHRVERLTVIIHWMPTDGSTTPKGARHHAMHLLVRLNQRFQLQPQNGRQHRGLIHLALRVQLLVRLSGDLLCDLRPYVIS